MYRGQSIRQNQTGSSYGSTKGGIVVLIKYLSNRRLMKNFALGSMVS